MAQRHKGRRTIKTVYKNRKPENDGENEPFPWFISTLCEMYNIKCLLEFFLSLATVALVTSLSSCLGTKFSTGVRCQNSSSLLWL